jgi:hypothetical protein
MASETGRKSRSRLAKMLQIEKLVADLPVKRLRPTVAIDFMTASLAAKCKLLCTHSTDIVFFSAAS